MYQTIQPIEGFVDEGDFAFVRDAVSNNHFPQLVRDLIDREPEIAFGVSEHFDRILRMLNGLPMSPGRPWRSSASDAAGLVAVDRHHPRYRRAWEDFLPSDETEGGGQ